MTNTAQTYYNAAQFHLAAASSFLGVSDANNLLNKYDYFWAHYAAGLSVECILRAHGMKADSEFVGRHDLMKLAEKSAFLSLPREARYDDYRSYLVEINERWRSDQRFMDEKQLERYLTDLGYDKIKGDKIKHSSQRMYELATRIVGLGTVKWNNLPNK